MIQRTKQTAKSTALATAMVMVLASALPASAATPISSPGSGNAPASTLVSPLPAQPAVGDGQSVNPYQEVRHQRGHVRRGDRGYRRHGRSHRRGSSGAGVALGAMGLILGMSALAASQAQPRHYHGGQHTYEPWTPEWFRYCENKYRSFDRTTGYYTAYSGAKRFCR